MTETKVEAGGGDADASLGLRLNKLHDVHLSYPLSLMRQQLLKWLIHHEDAPTPCSDQARGRASAATLRLSIMVPVSINQLPYRYYKYRWMFN